MSFGFNENVHAQLDITAQCTCVHLMQEQYHFLHMALIESLMLSSSALPSSKFLAAYDELLSYDDKNRCLAIKREFEVCFIFVNMYFSDTDTFADYCLPLY